jgi:hypothetical protein
MELAGTGRDSIGSQEVVIYVVGYRLWISIFERWIEVWSWSSGENVQSAQPELVRSMATATLTMWPERRRNNAHVFHTSVSS